jgi:hypothetical protein
MTPKELAAIIRVSEDKARSLIASGAIEGADVRRKGARRASYIVSEAAAEAFIIQLGVGKPMATTGRM